MTNRLERLALQRRMRVSAKRRIILEILDRARAPLTPGDVYQIALTGGLRISLPTIQRTLPQLASAGLLRRVHPAGRKTHYQKADQEGREYLVDIATGQRLSFHSEGIEGLLKQTVRQLGYRLLDYRLELRGQSVRSAGPADGDSNNTGGDGDATTASGRPPRRRRH